MPLFLAYGAAGVPVWIAWVVVGVNETVGRKGLKMKCSGFFSEAALLGDLGQLCVIMGVQDSQYGNLLFIAAVIALMSLACYAVILAFLKFENFVLRIEKAILEVSVFVYELRVALMKAGLIGKPSQEASGGNARKE